MTTNLHANLIDVFSSQAESYDGNGVTFFRPLAAKLLDTAEVGAGQRVLDVGTGRGAVLFPAAELVGRQGKVTGIDIAEGMVAATTRDIDERGVTNATLQLMDGHSPDFAAGSFDRILGSMSIIMIPDLPRTFANYHALLAEDGVLAFTAPAFDDSQSEWALGPFDLRAMFGELGEGTENANIAEFLHQFADMSSDVVLGDLRVAGFERPQAHRDTITVTAESGKALVAWSFTNGMRAFWDALPEDKRTELTARLAEQAEADRDADGEISYQVPVTVYTARK